MRSRFICKIIIFLFIIAFSSVFLFLKNPSQIDIALDLAKENRDELEKVLSHYKKEEKDSLKYKAALFLIENMPGHYSYNGNDIFDYYNDIAPILDSKISAKEKKDTIEFIASQYPNLRQNIIEDIYFISSDFLIKNIEDAFSLWKKPWAKHLTFDQFCEYLLPYKYAELQILDNWRDTLSTKFSDDLDKEPVNDELNESTFHVAQLINSEIRKKYRSLLYMI